MDSVVFKSVSCFMLWTVYRTVTSQNPILVADKAVVTENSSLTLTCILPREVVPTAWLKNGSANILRTGFLKGTCQSSPSPLPDGFSYACVNATTSTLTILQVNRTQSGDMWQCSVNRVDGISTFSNNITINVHVPITELTIKPNDDPFSLFDKKPMQFTCTSDFGRPAPSIFWYKDNGTSETSDDINSTSSASTSITSQNITTSTLTTIPSRSDHNMRLYCTGENGGSTVISEIKPLINVLFEPTPPVFRYNGSVITGRNALSGQQLMLLCESDGNPPPTYTWTYTGGSASGETLIIPNIQPHNEGNLTCTARNSMTSSAGLSMSEQKSSTIFVHVLVPITYVDIVGQNAVVIKENGSTTLECETSPGKPTATIQWYKDNGTPQSDLDDILFSSDDTTVTVMSDTSVKSILHYNATRLDNDMKIYCTASNVGQMLTSVRQIKLIIIALPVIPDKLNASAVTMDSVQLSWHYNFDDHILQSFVLEIKKEDLKWTEHRVKDLRINTSASIMYIYVDELEADTTYSIRMHAENALGRSGPSTVLTFTTLMTSDSDFQSCSTPSQSSQIGAISGGVVGGIAFGIIAGIVGSWFVICRRNTSKAGECSDCDTKDTQNTCEAKACTNPPTGGDSTYSSIHPSVEDIGQQSRSVTPVPSSVKSKKQQRKKELETKQSLPYENIKTHRSDEDKIADKSNAESQKPGLRHEQSAMYESLKPSVQEEYEMIKHS